MTEKRKSDAALFRRKIDAYLEYLRRPILEGGLAFTEYQISICLAFARFAVRALRELQYEHPDDCDCAHCDYRPEVENSVEEVAMIEGEP